MLSPDRHSGAGTGRCCHQIAILVLVQVDVVTRSPFWCWFHTIVTKHNQLTRDNDLLYKLADFYLLLELLTGSPACDVENTTIVHRTAAYVY